MSEELDFRELPDELRDMASRLRGLQPAAAKASQAESMYRAGWQAALAAHAGSASPMASSWPKSYFGGLASGALVSAALTAAFLLGIAKRSANPDVELGQGRLVQESSAPAADRPIEQNRSDEPLRPDARATAAQVPVLMRTAADESIPTSLLSPVARQQWQEVLMQTAASDASTPSQPKSSDQPAMEPMRSWAREMDQTWF
ncbi:MAG: hypothetical protein ACTHK7_00610 [Aureliella sp.]